MSLWTVSLKWLHTSRTIFFFSFFHINKAKILYQKLVETNGSVSHNNRIWSSDETLVRLTSLWLCKVSLPSLGSTSRGRPAGAPEPTGQRLADIDSFCVDIRGHQRMFSNGHQLPTSIEYLDASLWTFMRYLHHLCVACWWCWYRVSVLVPVSSSAKCSFTELLAGRHAPSAGARHEQKVICELQPSCQNFNE